MLPTYALYLESGPQRKKTLAHVLDLLGCVVQADTTDEVVAAAPDTIRAYLRYLGRHGEKVDPNSKIETRVAQHNTEGMFSGQALWPQDLKQVAPSALARYVRWLEWSRADLLGLVKGIDDKSLRAKPPKGRALRDILLHVLDADKSYVYALVGPLKAMGERTYATAKTWRRTKAKSFIGGPPTAANATAGNSRGSMTSTSTCTQSERRRVHATRPGASGRSRSNAIRRTRDRSRFVISPLSSDRAPTSATRSSAILCDPGKRSGATERPQRWARTIPEM